jgi:hypothetical protein
MIAAIPFTSNTTLEIFPYSKLAGAPATPLADRVDSSNLLFEASGSFFYIYPKDSQGRIIRDEYVEWITLGAFGPDVDLSTRFLGFEPGINVVTPTLYALRGEFANGMRMELTVNVTQYAAGRDSIKIGWTITNPSFEGEGLWQLVLVINSRTPLSNDEYACTRGIDDILKAIAMSIFEPVELFYCIGSEMRLSSQVRADLEVGALIDFVYRTKKFNVTFSWAAAGELDDRPFFININGSYRFLPTLLL